MAIKVSKNLNLYWLLAVLTIAVLSILFVHVSSAQSENNSSNVNFATNFTDISFITNVTNVSLVNNVTDVSIDSYDSAIPQPTQAPHISLNINSNPEGADVIFDGVNYGKTPLDITIDKPGIHSIRLELDGYDSWEEEYDPNIDSNEISVLLHKPDEGTLSNAVTNEETSSNIVTDEGTPSDVVTDETVPATDESPDISDFLGVTSLVVFLCGYIIMKSKK